MYAKSNCHFLHDLDIKKIEFCSRFSIRGAYENQINKQDMLVFNGINSSGSYDLPPMTTVEFSSLIQGTSPPENINVLKYRASKKHDPCLGVKDDVDPEMLDEAGWV